MTASLTHAADPVLMTEQLAETARDVVAGDAVGVITGVAVLDGPDVLLRIRSVAAPMHLVMGALAIVREAEDAIGRAPGPHRTKLAALAVARHALKQAME